MKKFFYRKFIMPFTGPSKLLNDTTQFNAQGVMIESAFISKVKCRYNKVEAERLIKEKVFELIYGSKEKTKANYSIDLTYNTEAPKDEFKWDRLIHDIIYLPRFIILPFEFLTFAMKMGEDHLDNAIEESDNCMLKGTSYVTKNVLFLLRGVVALTIAAINIPEVIITPLLKPKKVTTAIFKGVKKLIPCYISDDNDNEDDSDETNDVTTTEEYSILKLNLELRNQITNHLSMQNPNKQLEKPSADNNIENKNTAPNIPLEIIIEDDNEQNPCDAAVAKIEKDNNDMSSDDDAGLVLYDYASNTTPTKEDPIIEERDVITATDITGDAVITLKKGNVIKDNPSQETESLKLHDTISAVSLQETISSQNTADTNNTPNIDDNEITIVYRMSNHNSENVPITPNNETPVENDDIEIIYNSSTKDIIITNDLETLGNDQENTAAEFS